jgi:sodium transport system permease protein
VWRNVRLIFSKELKDTLRDRRTLFIMILLPILLYPILIIAVTQIVAVQTMSLRSQVYKVKIWNAKDAPSLGKLLESYAAGKPNPNVDPDKKNSAPHPLDGVRRLEILWENTAYAFPGLQALDGNAAAGNATDSGVMPDETGIIELVRRGIDSRKFYAGMFVPPGFEEKLRKGGNAALIIVYDSTNERSKEAGLRLRRFAREWYIEPLERSRQKDILARAGMSERDLRYFRPVEIPRRDLASPTAQIRYFIAMVLPMMLITMVLTGAFYPAIDLSAGEKERGTMETLLVSPASRLEIVLGKYFTVGVIALVTALLNILSLGFTFLFLAATMMPAEVVQAPGTVAGGAVVGFGAVAAMFIVMLPLAALFSALALAISSFARSFKEGQNYLTPFLVLVTLPAMASMVPGISLTAGTCLVPVFNTSLLFKSLLMQKAEMLHIVLVFGSNALYAAFAINWTVHLFQREEILFRSMDEVSWRFWKSRPKPGGLPTAAQALVAFFLALTLQITVGQFAQSKNILIGVPVTLIGIIGGGALIFALWGRFDAKRTFRFNVPRAGDVVTGLAIALCCIFIAREIVFLQSLISPSISESMRGFEREMTKKLMPLFSHPAIAIFYIALLPGIFEELFFRGPVLRGLESGRKQWKAAVICGILFGIMHLDFSRVVPTGAIGIMLAFLALRSGSIFPAIIAHISYNGINVIQILLLKDQSMAMQIEIENAITRLSHYFAIPCLLAVILLLWQTRSPRAKSH